KVPDLVFNVSRDLQLEFLRALFNGDGHVRRGYEAVYVTASKKLADDLKYLLSLLGFTFSYSTKKPETRVFKLKQGDFESKVSECYYIYTQARELYGGREKANVSFMNLLPISELGEINTKNIGWENRRALKRQKYLTKDKARTFNYAFRGDIKKIIDGDLGVLKVKSSSLVESPSEFIYDITLDKHHRFLAGDCLFVHNCIGGVPGNRTTMLVVPMVAAAGLTIPKTSSRAITSPAGTADVMEVLTNISLNLDEIKKVTEKTGGCMVWGGAVNLAAADDKLIRIRHPLHLDPKGMLLASILAKKKAVGAELVVIDIPAGRGAKVPDLESAEALGRDFLAIGKNLGMKVEAVVTDGSQPIGSLIGPALEAKDILTILMSNGKEGSQDLVEKACQLAGILLELAEKCKPGKGYDKALEMLEGGKAYLKFKEIITAQGGNGSVKPEDLKIGEFRHGVRSKKSGRIEHIDNRSVARICRAAGTPKDHSAGMILQVHRGDRVSKGDLLFEIVSSSKVRLNDAKKLAEERNPVEFQKIVLKELLGEQPVKTIPWKETRFE
ncbi:MAG: thymidine phosphorylase, partial [Candidatus Diapherotrites archaeon]|nr:thymidine phosphorylase [Candidatus Diapherotrites archaeon]